MQNEFIKIRGARVHNLKNIDLDLPKNKLVVITGLSGSGKSSLAFDTLYAEGQRKYVESLSAYARQFLGVMDKPDVDRIEGISPAISIDQRKSTHNPRSTVGTITEIYDYLRLLYARIGKPHCPNCGKLISRQTVSQIVDRVLKLPNPSSRSARSERENIEIIILGPVIRSKKGEHYSILEEIQRSGFVRVRVDGKIYLLEEIVGGKMDSSITNFGEPKLVMDKQKKHDIEVVVDQLVLNSPPHQTKKYSTNKEKEQNDSSLWCGGKEINKSRLVDSLEIALRLGKGIVIVHPHTKRGGVVGENTKEIDSRSGVGVNKKEKSKGLKENDLIFSEYFACEECGISLPELEPRLFSFNNPYGACPECTGLGEKLEVDPELVIPNKRLTIAEGAIWPWSRASHKVGRQGHYYSILSGLAEKYNFSLDEEIGNLPKKVIDIILNGEGSSPANFGQKGIAGEVAGKENSPKLEGDKFEGVIANLQRRYHETDSDWTRQEIEQYMVIKVCPKCQGKRLKPEVLAVTIGDSLTGSGQGLSIDKVVGLSIDKVKELFEKLPSKLNTNELKISQPIFKEIINRAQFLNDVGLSYLTLSRKAGTLAGGEEQRIRLATQIGSKLSGVLYILDEPSIGLHARDQHKLIDTLIKLKELGNTVIVVEHDSQTMLASDWIVDIGPGAGKHGGKVVFQGTVKELLKSHTLTGDYLSGRKKVDIEKPFRHGSGQVKLKENAQCLIIKGAQEHNLKNIDAKIPLGKFVCVTGVSGSGKSSLVNDILARALLKKFYRAKDEPGKCKEILGVENLNKVVLVDQSPIGRTPRSNPATYTGAFSYIRDVFTETKEARVRGYSAGKFSFNVKGGRCETCEGQGQKKVEMYFLPDIYVECSECRGKRYSKEILEITYKDKNISEVLEMTVEEAMEFFKNIPGLYEKLKTLKEVGLSYVALGQSATSLSGGEAQRVKLATELSKKGTGRTLYILDEPTTGLHFDDIKKLIFVLGGLVKNGNTVLVIEHNIDLIKNADWIIDLGPEGGDKGGQIIAEGTPQDISKAKNSYTGQYLKNK